MPHIAAYAKALLAHGYSASRSSFSRYRTFARDGITKKAGTGYETDAEFYAPDGSIWLHLEAKRDRLQVDAVAAQLERAADIRDLPRETVKEIEYVLELAPRYLWVVGPGSIDPPTHVFAVQMNARTVRFDRLAELPGPPAL